MSILSPTWLEPAIRNTPRNGIQPVQLPSTPVRVAPLEGTRTGALGRLAVTTDDSYQLSALVRERLPLERRMAGIASSDIILRALGCWT